jgi:hypothetical protein
VEEREEKDRTTGELVLRRVPTLVTIGWHGMGRVMRVMGESVASAVSYMSDSSEGECLDVPSVPRFASTVGKDRDKKMDILMHILSLQKAGGGIELDERLSELLDLRMKHLQKMAKLIQGSMPVDKILLLSTAILLSILELHFRNVPEMWRSMVTKSRDWLDDVIKKSDPRIRGEELMVWAKEFVKSSISI